VAGTGWFSIFKRLNGHRDYSAARNKALRMTQVLAATRYAYFIGIGLSLPAR
jgi:hypothetical protein